MATFLPDAGNVIIENVKEHDGTIVVQARSCQTKVVCPKCGGVARRVHSRYARHVKDITWLGHSSRLVLVMRKFFCDVDECPLRIFAEQLPRIVVRYGRLTIRLTERLRSLGLSLGGNQAAAVSGKLDRLQASRRTILRLVRSTLRPEKPPPTRLGVDDFAFRRGNRYGTILIDLDRHEPFDLLPDRLSETLASWLKDHPGIEVISRDRAGAYAVRLGAPAAIQVADRWHLLKNLGDALERFLAHRHASLSMAGKAATLQADISPKQMKETRQTVDHKVRRERRLGIYETVISREGFGIREISQNLGMSRATVRKYVRNGCLTRLSWVTQPARRVSIRD